MRIRYSPPHDLELEGTSAELCQVSHVMVTHGSGYFSAEEDFDPAPYKQHLLALRIEAGHGPTQVLVQDAEVVIRVSSNNLQRVASFFTAPTDQSHAHVEWVSGDEHVAQESIPLVISRQDKQKA